MVKLFRWIWSQLYALWRLIFAGAGTMPSGPDELLDTRRIIFSMQPVITLGLIAVIVTCGAHWAQGLLWALACVALGFFGGFLFGIPKVLQHKCHPMPFPNWKRFRFNLLLY